MSTTAILVGKKLWNIFGHPAMSVIMMGLALFIIPITLIMHDNYYDLLLIIWWIGIFLISLDNFIDWKIKKLMN